MMIRVTMVHAAMSSLFIFVFGMDIFMAPNKLAIVIVISMIR